MLECDYRYIVEQVDDMLAGFKYRRSLEEIAERFKNSGVKARVEGKEYGISREAARLYCEYKDSIIAAAVRLSYISMIPLSEVTDALLGKQHFMIGEIFFNSFFNSDLSQCVKYAAMCVPDKFESIKYKIDGRELVPGDMLCNDGDEVYNGKNGIKYVVHQKNYGVINVQRIRKGQEITAEKIYEGSVIKKAYATIINDMTKDFGKSTNRINRAAICTAGLNGVIDAEVLGGVKHGNREKGKTYGRTSK